MILNKKLPFRIIQHASNYSKSDSSFFLLYPNSIAIEIAISGAYRDIDVNIQYIHACVYIYICIYIYIIDYIDINKWKHFKK